MGHSGEEAVHAFPVFDQGSGLAGRTEGGGCRPLSLLKYLPVPGMIQEDGGLESTPARPKLAWEGCFGNIPLLMEDPDYETRMKRILGSEPKESHKICRACWKSFPYDAKFCYCRGGQLPDQLFCRGPKYSFARLQLGEIPLSEGQPKA